MAPINLCWTCPVGLKTFLVIESLAVLTIKLLGKRHELVTKYHIKTLTSCVRSSKNDLFLNCIVDNRRPYNKTGNLHQIFHQITVLCCCVIFLLFIIMSLG